MVARGVFVLFSWFALMSVLSALQGFDFNFKLKDSKTPRVMLVDSDAQPVKQLATGEVSICVWVFIENPADSETVTLVSFSSRDSGHSNELLLEISYSRNYTGFTIHGKGQPFAGIPPRNQWTHICTTWENTKGNSHFYVDGQRKFRKNHLKKESISGNGYLVLGQDQDDFNGKYDPSDGLQGKLTQFNLWDRALSEEEVKNAHLCEIQGNVVNWPDATWGMYDGMEMLPSDAPCGADACNIP